MHFVIITSIVMFVFSSIAWFGGYLFISGVLLPIAKHDNSFQHNIFFQSFRRFYGISIMCLWTIFITGLIILATNQKYIWLKFETDWDYLLFVLEIIFLLASSFTFLIGNHFNAIDASLNDGFDFHMNNIFRYSKINIYLGIIFILIISCMVYYG